MSPAYRYDEAGPEDEAALRELAHSVGMRSSTFRLSYRRDPDYFHGLAVEGHDCQVVTVRERDTGQIVACGSRALRPVWIDGEETWVGYYGGLRIHPDHRGGTVLARGYRHLRKFHEDGRVKLYTTTILEENEEAIRLLTSARAGLPTYSPMGRYLCQAVVLGGGERKEGAIRIREGREDDGEAIVACLRRNGRRRQFAPVWTLEDFAPDSSVTRGLRFEDFLVATGEDRVVGCIARWDQSAFKQTIVEGYGGYMALLRPLWGLVAPWLDYRALPIPGAELPFFFAACPAVDDDDPRIFRALVTAMANRFRRGDYAYFVLGLHERDPLREVLSEFRPSFTYPSRVYVVTWEDGAEALASLDGRVPYLEAAVL